METENTTKGAEMTEWRQRIEREIENHRAHGKTPKNLPRNESDWQWLHDNCPKSHYAAWYVLTGRRIGW